MSVILGRDIILYLVNDAAAVVEIGCGLDVQRAGEREMLETSDNTSGRFTKYIAGKITQRLLVNGLTGWSNGSLYDSDDLYDKLVAAGTNLINFQYKQDTGVYVFTYSGSCLVSSFQETSPINGASAYNCTLQVVGEITKTQTGSYLPYYWVTSPTPLTASQVVNLIETGDPSVTSVSAPSYSTITINWGVPAGAYLYFAIPAISPDRLSYYVNMGDTGRIGQPGDLFEFNLESITVGTITANYKVYSSNVSKVNNSPMDLRTYYPTTGGIMGYGTTVYLTVTAPSSGVTMTVPGMVGVQMNKIIVILRGGLPATNIIAAPAVPTEGQMSYDATTGTITVNSNVPFVGEDVTFIYLS